MSGIAQQLSIVSASSISAWESLSQQQQQQISAAVTPNSQIECVVYPETPAALAETIAWAWRDCVPFLLCGSMSKLHWGGLAQVRLVISTAKMNRLIEHAIGDLTVTAEAGMRLADLQAVLAAQGQFLPIDPAFPELATLGGIVATADTGSLRQRYGGIRDLLIGVNLVRSDGQLAKAGGRVVKNVAGYDLMKLMTGSWGTLAAIAQVTLRIYPIASASQTVILTGAAASIAQAAQTLIGSSLTPIAADLLPPATVQALNLGEGFGLMVRFASIEISVTEQVNSLMKVGAAIGLKAQTVTGADEVSRWQALREQVTDRSQDGAIDCKIGVLPAEAIDLLTEIQAIAPLGFIHASSGLGTLRFADLTVEQLGKLRSRCEAGGGFLTVLAGSIALKQQFNIWGNVGNALPIMKSLKQQFDPHNLLSPDRFVGGI